MRTKSRPGGYGVVLLHPRKRAEISGGFRKTTNNRMEIYAAIAGTRIVEAALPGYALQRFAVPGESDDGGLGSELEKEGLVAHQQGTPGER